MEKIKKITILLIILILSMTANVYAENEKIEITLKPSSTEVKSGDTISIVISAKAQSELEGISGILEYDNTKLEFTKYEVHEYYTDLTGKDEETKKTSLCVMYGTLVAPDTAPQEAELITLTFKVLDTAVVGETLKIELKEVLAGDFIYEDWVELTDKQVELLVVNNEQTPNEEQKPSQEEQTPSQGEQTPNKEETKKDQTAADKTINKAGSETYSFIFIIATIVMAVIMYKKCNEYKGIK